VKAGVVTFRIAAPAADLPEGGMAEKSAEFSKGGRELYVPEAAGT
jgi:hypothetical protein